MHQDVTWYGGRTQRRRLCVRWGPSPLPQKGQSFSFAKFSAHVYCGQTAAWIKMPLGTEVGRSRRPTRHCVRCGPSYSQKKGHTHPHPILAHVYCDQIPGWMKTPLSTEVDRGPGHIVLDGVPAPAKGAQQPPPLLGPCLLWPPSPIPATAELLLSIYRGAAVAAPLNPIQTITA